MTNKEPTLEEMAEQISDLQTQLSEMKKAYNDKKYAPIMLQKKLHKKQKLCMVIGVLYSLFGGNVIHF